MRKVFSLLLVLALGFFLVTGCQQAQEAAPITAEEAAGDCAQLTKFGLFTDNMVETSLKGSPSTTGLTISTITRTTDGWWYVENSQTGQVWKIYARLWDENGSELTTIAKLVDWKNGLIEVDKIWTYTELDLTEDAETLTFKMGESKSNPLKFEGRVNPPQTLNGPMSLSGIANGKSYVVSKNYSEITLTPEGYPYDGQVSFSVAVRGEIVLAGTISYDGSSTATLTFTSGAEGTYTIDISTGQVI